MDTPTVLAESWTKMYKDPSNDLAWMDDLDVSSFRDGILTDVHKYKTLLSEMVEPEKEPVWNHNEVSNTQYPQHRRHYRSTDVKPYFKAPAPVMRHESALKKPPMSYANMAALALKNSPTGELPVKDIYKYMIERWPYYKNAPGSWKNSLRHTLATNEKFMKREINQGKIQGRNPSVWLIVPQMMEKVDLDLALASTRTDNEEDYENDENMAAAAAIASSPVARAEGRPYKYTPRNVAQRPSFTFKPAKETMASFAHCAIFIRTPPPSSFAGAARDPSEIGLFDSPTPQNSQRAPMRRPALVPTYPTGDSASYGMMRSPSRSFSTINSANRRAIRDPSDISLSAALDAERVRMSTPSIMSRKRPATHPGNTGPPAKASSYGMMRKPPRSMDNEVNAFRGERMLSPLKDSRTLNSLNGGTIPDPYDISPFGSPVRRNEHNPILATSRTSFIETYSSVSSLEASVSGDLFENLDDFFILRDE